MTRFLPVWMMRLLLGALFFWGSDVLLWLDAPSRPLHEWVLRLVGYGVLACLILDLASRYRIRDVYDSMALIAIYALLVGALLAPQSTLNDLPRTLLTRVLGGHGLVGIEMFGVFLVLIGGNNRRALLILVGASVWNGFYWGVWMRWMPELGGLFAPVSPTEMFFLALGGLLPALLLWGAVRVVPSRLATLEPSSLMMGRVGWLIVIAIGFAYLLLRGLDGTLNTGALVPIVLLIIVSWAVLWFRRSDKGRTLLDDYLPPHPISPLWVVLAMACFGLAVGVAYVLPLVQLAFFPQFSQLWLMEIGFGAVGALWYPTVAAVVAFRGVDAQLRTGEL